VHNSTIHIKKDSTFSGSFSAPLNIADYVQSRGESIGTTLDTPLLFKDPTLFISEEYSNNLLESLNTKKQISAHGNFNTCDNCNKYLDKFYFET
jgi:hypothetical protein